MTGPEPSPRATLLGALAILAAFGVGFGTATLVPEDAARAPAAHGPPPALFEDLELTADQRAVVDSVLSATRASTARALEETRMELTAQAVEAIRAIEAVLDPAQIETLKARIEARKAAPVLDEEQPGAGPSDTTGT